MAFRGVPTLPPPSTGPRSLPGPDAHVNTHLLPQPLQLMNASSRKSSAQLRAREEPSFSPRYLLPGRGKQGRGWQACSWDVGECAVTDWGGSVPAAPVPSRPLAWQGPRSQHLRGRLGLLTGCPFWAGWQGLWQGGDILCRPVASPAPVHQVLSGVLAVLGRQAWGATSLSSEGQRAGEGVERLPGFQPSPGAPAHTQGEKLCGSEGWDAGHWLLGVWNLLCPLMTPGHARWPLCPWTCSGTLTPAATSRSFHVSV